ncbi:hypothetical protein F4703DRAFT_1797205 [Phycomyces blakesleeanus]
MHKSSLCVLLSLSLSCAVVLTYSLQLIKWSRYIIGNPLRKEVVINLSMLTTLNLIMFYYQRGDLSNKWMNMLVSTLLEHEYYKGIVTECFCCNDTSVVIISKVS